RRRRIPFIFQAEDGIRDDLVTGVQTCALPISKTPAKRCNAPVTPRGERGISLALRASSGTCFGNSPKSSPGVPSHSPRFDLSSEIGRASCRERVLVHEVDCSLDAESSCDALMY